MGPHDRKPEPELGRLFAALERELLTTESVCAAYVFGSVATGKAGARSDLDVAVILRPTRQEPAFWECIDIAGRLEDRLGVAVDVLDMERIPPSLAHEVLVTGRLILDRDPGRRVLVEEKVTRDYWDVLPYRRYYRREVIGAEL